MQSKLKTWSGAAMTSFVEARLDETRVGSCMPKDVKMKIDYTKFKIIFMRIAFLLRGC